MCKDHHECKTLIGSDENLQNLFLSLMPNADCPSDHPPIIAKIKIPTKEEIVALVAADNTAAFAQLPAGGKRTRRVRKHTTRRRK